MREGCNAEDYITPTVASMAITPEKVTRAATARMTALSGNADKIEITLQVNNADNPNLLFVVSGLR